MDSVRHRVRWAGILAILALTAAAAACGGDSAPEPTAPDTSSPSPSVTEASAVTDTAAPEPSIAASELAIYVDEDTILREVFDAFAGSEQACIRGAVDDELLESVLDMLVLSDDLTDELAASIVSCLAPETAREFLLSAIIASLEAEGLNIEVGTNAEACMREFLADIDVAAMANAMTSESGDPVFGDGLLGCIHADALREATPVTVGEPAPGQINHDADVDFFVFEGEQGELYQIDVTLGTLSDSVATLYDSDGLELDYNDDYGDTSASRIYWEAQSSGNHYVAVESWSGIGSYTLTIAVANITDDHAGALREATPVTVGEPAPGEINPDADGDVDFFVFEGEQGELYQIDVTLGTLFDSVATLYDSDGLELGYSDGYGDTSASRIYWEAQSSGNHYVAVESWSGIGSYTLTIAVANITDDHAGALREATPVTVGEPAPGEINYDADVDFFVFEGEQGELYQIDVTLGTLSDSVATLYDSDGFDLDYTRRASRRRHLRRASLGSAKLREPLRRRGRLVRHRLVHPDDRHSIEPRLSDRSSRSASGVPGGWAAQGLAAHTRQGDCRSREAAAAGRPLLQAECAVEAGLPAAGGHSTSVRGWTPVGAHNSVVGADQGFRAPSRDQESVRDSG